MNVHLKRMLMGSFPVLIGGFLIAVTILGIEFRKSISDGQWNLIVGLICLGSIYGLGYVWQTDSEIRKVGNKTEDQE